MNAQIPTARFYREFGNWLKELADYALAQADQIECGETPQEQPLAEPDSIARWLGAFAAGPPAHWLRLVEQDGQGEPIDSRQITRRVSDAGGAENTPPQPAAPPPPALTHATVPVAEPPPLEQPVLEPPLPAPLEPPPVVSPSDAPPMMTMELPTPPPAKHSHSAQSPPVPETALPPVPRLRLAPENTPARAVCEPEKDNAGIKPTSPLPAQPLDDAHEGGFCPRGTRSTAIEADPPEQEPRRTRVQPADEAPISPLPAAPRLRIPSDLAIEPARLDAPTVNAIYPSHETSAPPNLAPPASAALAVPSPSDPIYPPRPAALQEPSRWHSSAAIHWPDLPRRDPPAAIGAPAERAPRRSEVLDREQKGKPWNA